MMRFESKSVLVTGGTRGIGAAIAQAFIAEGARVAINGRTAASTAAAAADMAAAVKAPGDVATVAGCEAAVTAALIAFGGLDILVNNAGVFARGAVEDTDEATWDAVMNANVKSVQFCTRAALPALRNAKGAVVNIASESGLNGYPETTAYCASKGAVVNLTRAMAMEFAPDVRVNALCPVAAETPLFEGVVGEITDAKRERFTATIPLGRLAVPDDVASAAVYLASDEATFMTGVLLPIDGGRTAM